VIKNQTKRVKHVKIITLWLACSKQARFKEIGKRRMRVFAKNKEV